MVGLNWFDPVGANSELGLAIGAPAFVTAYRNPAGERGAAGTAWDTTPLPLGHGARLSAFGGLVKLRLRF